MDTLLRGALHPLRARGTPHREGIPLRAPHRVKDTPLRARATPHRVRAIPLKAPHQDRGIPLRVAIWLSRDRPHHLLSLRDLNCPTGSTSWYVHVHTVNFKFHVAYVGNLWFVRPIDCNVKHSIFQSINFPYMQHRMFSTRPLYISIVVCVAYHVNGWLFSCKVNYACTLK